MRSCKDLKGGLQDVADDLGVRHCKPEMKPMSYCSFVVCSVLQVIRHGASHQAGSDSLLTSQTFFKLKEVYFNDEIDDVEYSGKLYGLGPTFSVTNGLTDPSRGGATIAERDDRSSIRDIHNQTPGPVGGPQQGQGVSMNMTLQALSSMSPGAYTNQMNVNGPYMRTSLVGGR